MFKERGLGVVVLVLAVVMMVVAVERVAAKAFKEYLYQEGWELG